MTALICGAEINTQFVYDFFQCVDFYLLKKKNGEEYIKLKLANSKGIYDSYLWNNLNIYKNRIKKKSIYAVKAKTEVYNMSTILNVKNIKKIDNDIYNKYGYTPKAVKITKNIKNQFYFNEIVNIASKYNNHTLNEILGFYKKNKNYFIEGESLEKKLNTIKYIVISHESSFSEYMMDEYICAILLYGVNKSLLDQFYLNLESDDLINLYTNHEKEFIKKYKIIVDLMTLKSINQSK